MGSFRELRLSVVVILSTLVLTAFFLAQGTAGLLAAAALDLDAVGGPQSLLPRTASALGGSFRTRQKDAIPILRRNMFDSQTGPLDQEPQNPEAPTVEPVIEEVLVPGAPLPACEGSVRLVGAVYSDRFPEWSFAAVTDATGKAMLYRAGMQLDGRELVAIEPNRVVLKPSGGRHCQMGMFAPINPGGGMAMPSAVSMAPPTETAMPPRPELPAREGAISSAELEAGISRVSGNEFNVNRTLVNKVLENQSELMRSARIIPHQEGGRTVGVKLYGIRNQSLLGRLGLENGDMMRTINGFDMTSPDSALEAYARLRNADHLTISVIRRGQPVTLDYSIR